MYITLGGMQTLRVYYLENKGIVYKARLVCTVWYKDGRDNYVKWNDEGIARVIPLKTGHARVVSGSKNQARIKNNTFIPIRKHFQSANFDQK